MTSETRTFAEAAALLPDDFYLKCAKHFLKAVRKHPRFADALHGYRDSEMVKTYLKGCREILVSKRQNSKVYATDLLECEILEAWCAPNDQETISELYDAVAVLMRMIAVVEGKQRLGGEE